MGIRSSFINGVAVSATVALGACVVSAAGAPVPASITTPHAVAREDPMTVLALQSSIEPGADKQVVSLFTGPRRTLVQITLRNGATLEAHKAAVLVTLEPGVVHEIVAAPSVSVLLTQFTDR